MKIRGYLSIVLEILCAHFIDGSSYYLGTYRTLKNAINKTLIAISEQMKLTGIYAAEIDMSFPSNLVPSPPSPHIGNSAP